MARDDRSIHPEGVRDDFVYYLHRGSSLLLQDRVGDAKEELERALQLQPQDAKSQDLLAGVYYRLGVYPRAIELWSNLVQAMPDEPTLRVNLALVLFKTGQAEQAREHIDAALAVQPEHKRAWGYLGLIHWRQGRVREARDAFIRAGQGSMARRMEDALDHSSPGMVEAPPTDHLDAHDRAAMRGAAEEALEHLTTHGDALAVDAAQRARRRSGAWEAVEPGEESVPAPPRLPHVRPAARPSTLANQLARWMVEVPPGHTMVRIGKNLHVQSGGDVCMRLEGLCSVRGELEAHHLPRTDGSGPLGGTTDPLWKVSAPVDLIVCCDEQEVHVLEVEDAPLFVEESRVLAFDGTLRYQSAELPLGRQSGMVVQFRGKGAVALRTRSEPTALAVSGEELRVDPPRLVGWTGRLFPTGGRGTAPYSVAAPRLVFRGDGVVLVD